MLLLKGKISGKMQPCAAEPSDWPRHNALMATSVTLADLQTDYEHCVEVWQEHGCFIIDDLIEPPLLYAPPPNTAANKTPVSAQGGRVTVPAPGPLSPCPPLLKCSGPADPLYHLIQ